MQHKLHIVIPVATRGTPSQSYTVSRPLPLLPIAGKPLLSHLLEGFDSLPKTYPRTFVLVTDANPAPYTDILSHSHPDIRFQLIEKGADMGPAHALYLARAQLNGPVLLTLPDRIIEADLSFLGTPPSTPIVWTRNVARPGLTQYAITGPEGRVREIAREPDPAGTSHALTGQIYFPDPEQLLSTIEEQIIQDRGASGIFPIEETLAILLENEVQIRIEPAGAWLSAGTKAELLEMNAYLLEKGHTPKSAPIESDGVTVIPPIDISPTAQIEGSIIGPNVSIGANVHIQGSVLHDCVIDDDSILTGCRLSESVIGRHATVHGVSGIISVGDHAVIASNRTPG